MLSVFQKGASSKGKADLTRLVIGYTHGQKTLTFLRLRTTYPIVMEHIPQSQQTINLGVMEEEQRIKCYVKVISSQLRNNSQDIDNTDLHRH